MYTRTGSTALTECIMGQESKVSGRFGQVLPLMLDNVTSRVQTNHLSLCTHTPRHRLGKLRLKVNRMLSIGSCIEVGGGRTPYYQFDTETNVQFLTTTCYTQLISQPGYRSNKKQASKCENLNALRWTNSINHILCHLDGTTCIVKAIHNLFWRRKSNGDPWKKSR